MTAVRTVRAHIVLAADLVDEVDAIVGPRQRSTFVAEAISEKLRKERQTRLFRKFAGSLANEDVPGWETPEAAAAWVRALREADSDRLDRLWTNR